MLNKRDFERFKNASPEIKSFLLKNLLKDVLNLELIPLQENIIKSSMIEKEINIEATNHIEATNLKKINKEKEIQIKNSIAEIKSLIDFIDNDK